MTRPAELKAAIDLYRIEHPGRQVDGRWRYADDPLAIELD
jgi:hypothetical protein